MSVDINCDMGESFGAWRIGDDDALMPLVTSANIACGMHAGDPHVIARTVRLAAQHGVAIGAHPGLPDLAGFGRRAMQLSPDEAYDVVVHQVGAVHAHARAAGLPMSHVKPHGALYNMAATDAAIAAAIAAAVHDFDRSLMLFGLAGSASLREAERAGLRAVSEVFADRAYEPDGSLTPRALAGAVLDDAASAAARALRMVREGLVAARNGVDVRVRAETICVHGDSPHAVAIVRRLRAALEGAGIVVKPVAAR